MVSADEAGDDRVMPAGDEPGVVDLDFGVVGDLVVPQCAVERGRVFELERDFLAVDDAVEVGAQPRVILPRPCLVGLDDVQAQPLAYRFADYWFEAVAPFAELFGDRVDGRVEWCPASFLLPECVGGLVVRQPMMMDASEEPIPCRRCSSQSWRSRALGSTVTVLGWWCIVFSIVVGGYMCI